MIFKDKLDEKTKLIRPEIDKLLDLALKNQNHIGDLLLCHVNGFFQEEILLHNQQSNSRLNPHVIGPGLEGLSENAHFNFIHKYRTTNISNLTYSQYQEEIKYSPEKKEKIDELTDFEEISIQLEMLIYLKFWEADSIIKKLYQFTRALNGEHYDWYFKVAESARDKQCTGTRQDIIRLLIRDKIETHSSNLAQVFKDTYKTQIRNAIAHSNYSFLGRSIGLNNFIKEDPHSQLSSVKFNDWVDIFHNTIVLYNEYIRMNSLINEYYAGIALKMGNVMEILISERSGKQYPLYIEYREQWKDWKYKLD